MRRFLPLLLLLPAVPARAADTLPNTQPLTDDGDLAAKMVEGIGKYLDRALDESDRMRDDCWKVDYSSVDAYLKSVAPKRERLRKILGVVDPRVPFTDLEYVGGPRTPSLIAETDDYKVYAVRWPVLAGVEGDGLLLEPKGKVVACVVALPDADWTPEMLVGLAAGVPKESQFARRLAENGCRVLVPTLIDRKDTWSGNAALGKMTNQPHREFIYRQAYEMGRHIIGYEIQKVLAAVDWFCREKDHPPVGVYGYAEGGLLALSSAAIDPRIQAVVVSGYFSARENVWQEPIYRNVWGLLAEFGDAELAWLVAPRTLIVENSAAPRVTGPPRPHDGRTGAAPGGPLIVLTPDGLGREQDRTLRFLAGADFMKGKEWFVHLALSAKPGFSVNQLLRALGYDGKLKGEDGPEPEDRRKDCDPDVRQHRQFDHLVDFTQKLVRDSAARREESFWSKLDTSSLEKYEASCKPLRERFGDEVIGRLPPPTEKMNPRSRLIYDEPKWKGYEVTLDLYPDVFAYGILLLPKDVKPGEKRPVIVCQHGRQGRPAGVCDPKAATNTTTRSAPGWPTSVTSFTPRRIPPFSRRNSACCSARPTRSA